MSRLSLVALSVLLVAIVTADMPYQLSSGFEDIVPNLVETFTCEGRPYGYYADVANDCRLFHVCVPVVDDVGETLQTDQYSFLCGNETIFDQFTLTCNYPVDAVPCEDAESMYSLANDVFFKLADGSSA
ncbi:U-scoloptoxin(01)-Er1a-like [Pollicipes pollicipes]|nr:U-scoloptoxin(01)-Er1a-like [Pollicipes pollicipes]XP_037081338.1 U-scoloptoxin(01)-Er1a-like [Pollicipes pollicipes]XP_037090280.1 U-scoloptoxin(01)-Er1a-like [Pollicipes pollicipes]